MCEEILKHLRTNHSILSDNDQLTVRLSVSSREGRTILYSLSYMWWQLRAGVNIGWIHVSRLAMKAMGVAFLHRLQTHIEDVTTKGHDLQVFHLVELIHWHPNGYTWKSDREDSTGNRLIISNFSQFPNQYNILQTVVFATHNLKC